MQERFKTFIYKTSVKWKQEKKGLLKSNQKPDIEVATPPEFKGHPNIWSPEDLFIAAVDTCIMTTFLYFIERKNINLLSYESDIEGIIEMVEGNLIFTKIKVFPKIKVNTTDEIELAKNLIKRSEKSCLISNSIKTKIEVIADIYN